MDASELVRELEATQKEVADMLTGQAAAEQELTGMKEACSSEVRTDSRDMHSIRPPTARGVPAGACDRALHSWHAFACTNHQPTKVAGRCSVCGCLCMQQLQLQAARSSAGYMLTHPLPPHAPVTSPQPQLAQLQEETWRLQIFAELEKMKGLISQLRPIEDDAAPAGDAGPPAAAAAAASGSPAASPQPARPWSSCAAGGGGEPRDGGDACGGGSDCEGGDGVRERDEALATIDSELAVLMGAIRVAKDEVSGLLASKCDLQQQIADIYSAELEGEDRDEASN